MSCGMTHWLHKRKTFVVAIGNLRLITHSLNCKLSCIKKFLVKW